MRVQALLVAAFVVTALPGARSASAQQVTKPAVPGTTYFSKLETTVACGGATKPEAMAELKKMGYASVINLRQPTEPDANIDAEAAAARATGIKFFSIPFNGQKPDPAVADTFIETITTGGNEPAYIHCATANRASAMWMIKRLVIDHWDADKASAEASALGLTNTGLKQFAIDYAASHKK